MKNPPFCPNPRCVNHIAPTTQVWYKPAGFHPTKAFGDVPRFRCLSCRRTFSTQTFSVDYYAKKVVNYRDLVGRQVGAMSLRATARTLHVSCGTVQNRIDRCCRNALALHARLRGAANRHEAVCVDGFVGFDVSQFFPNEITISVTNESLFFLDISHASRRRSGTMTKAQRARATELYAQAHLEKGAVSRTFRDVLDSLARERPPTPEHPLILITDEKRDYERVLQQHPLFREQDEEHRVAHLQINSKFPRTFQNPLFPSNYLDREIRKDQANHHRESTCFNRSVANGMSRLALYCVNHNYRKRYLIKAPVEDQRVHAEVAGIDLKT